MRIPYHDLTHAVAIAKSKAKATGRTWYVNRLASSGPMRWELADVPITDTSFGGGVVFTAWVNAEGDPIVGNPKHDPHAAAKAERHEPKPEAHE